MNKKGLIWFRFVELFTGNNISKLYHVIKNEKKQTVASGVTDENGLSVAISRDVGDTLYVYVKNIITGELKEKVRHTVVYKKEIVRVTSSKIMLDDVEMAKTTKLSGGYRYFTHKVKSGENLTAISRKFGCEVNDLISLNKLTDPNHIKVGQILKVPYKSSVNSNQEKTLSQKTKSEQNSKTQTKANQKSESKTSAESKNDNKKSNDTEIQNEIMKRAESTITSVFKRIASLKLSDDKTKDSGKPMKVAQEATSPCVCKQYDLVWGDLVNCEFRKKVVEISKEMWPTDTTNMANNLMACMHLESANTFRPDIENYAHYVGLIQIGKEVIEDLQKHYDKTLTKEKLKKMTAVQQLDVIKAHFMWNDHHKLMKSLTDMYLYINYPNNLLKGNNKATDTLYLPGSKAYHSNPAFMKEEGEYEHIIDYKKNDDGSYKLDKNGHKIPIRGFSDGKTYVWEVTEELRKHLSDDQKNKTNKLTCAYESKNKTNVNNNVDLNKFAETLDKRALAKSDSKCAKYVRIALEAAGADTKGHPVAASDWGATLIKNGYKEIPEEFRSPQKGDVYIITKTKVHGYGHIAGYDGKQWVSDFKQHSQVIYHDKVTYRYFRIV